MPNRDLEAVVRTFREAGLVFTMVIRAGSADEVVWRQVHKGLCRHFTEQPFQWNSEGLDVSPQAFEEDVSWGDIPWQLLLLKKKRREAAQSFLTLSTKQEREMSYAGMKAEVKRAMGEAGSSIAGSIFVGKCPCTA